HKAFENIKIAFKRVKEDNLFLLQKVEILEERLKEQDRTFREGFELLREQIELYKAEMMMSSLNSLNNSSKNSISISTSKKKNSKTNSNTKKTSKHDDLTRIEGIGPVIQKVLIDNKIATFKELSQTPAYKIEEVLKANNLQQHSAKSWPKQAALAHQGSWIELDKLQDELKGGR
ncbi:MAG: hypothetical protein LAT82_05320, partial [Nanoarchaeota archaeon]|nr:hypothetical protein [Nanoarchaeota archaeon]